MRACVFVLGLAIATLSSCTAGCQHTPSGPPTDPLFVSKKPIFAKPEIQPPTLVAYQEPEMPAGPVQAVAWRPRTFATPASETPPVRLTVRGQAP